MRQKRFHKKLSVLVSNSMYDKIQTIIKTSKQQFKQENPGMESWSDEDWARVFEACSVSGVVRDALELLIKKKLRKMPFYQHAELKCPQCGRIMRKSKRGYECLNEACPVIEVTVDASTNPIRIKTVKFDPTMREVKK